MLRGLYIKAIQFELGYEEVKFHHSQPTEFDPYKQTLDKLENLIRKIIKRIKRGNLPARGTAINLKAGFRRGR